MNEALDVAQIEHFWCLMRVTRDLRESRESRELKNLNFGVFSRRVNQSGACSSSDVITIARGGRNPKQQWRTKSSSLYVDTQICTINLHTFIETGIKRILLGRK